jgi:VanZ family protein
MTSLLRLAFWAAVLFAFTMAELPQPMIELSSSDKVQHMAAFFVITALGCTAYRGLSRIKLMLAMIAFGALIELVQMVPELHRDAEWSDWAADILSVLAALAVAHLVESRRAARAE